MRSSRFQKEMPIGAENERSSRQSRELVPNREDLSVDVSIASIANLGYSWDCWESNTKYWVFWTLWDQKMLDSLSPLSKMKIQDSFLLKNADFNRVINKAYTGICSDASFPHLDSQLEMEYLVVRLEFDEKNEPFSILSETVEIRGTEVVFGKKNASLSSRSIHLIACAGLAEILRAVCKTSDLLIVFGTWKRVFNNAGKCLLLLNFGNCNGKLQILRLPFSNAGEIFMAEKIKPTTTEKRFQFKYYVRNPDNTTRKEVSKHQDFKWTNEPSEQIGVDVQDFRVPIQSHQNPFEVYTFLVSNSCGLTSDTAPEYSPMGSSKRTNFEEGPQDGFNKPSLPRKGSPVRLSKFKEPPTPTSPRTRFSRARIVSRTVTSEVIYKNRPDDDLNEGPQNGENREVNKPVRRKSARSKFYVACGKIAVMGIMLIACMALFCLLFRPCSEKEECPFVEVKKQIDNIQVKEESVFEKDSLLIRLRELLILAFLKLFI